MDRKGLVWALCLACAAGAAGIALDKMAENSGRRADNIGAAFRGWRGAVLAGDERGALAFASKILAASRRQRPPYSNREYKDICRKNGIAPAFLDGGFDHWDFLAWSDAFFFKRLADRATAGTENDEDRIKALFRAVRGRVKPAGLPPGVLPWPRNAWNEEKGLCDRQAWLLSELAYQAGYDAWIVYLMTPGTTISPHTICEIRKDGSVWVADPYSGKLLSGKSVPDLAEDRNLAESFWPDRPDWRKAVANPRLFLPADPRDYRWKNQLLAKALRPMPENLRPRFGEDPGKRLRHAMEKLDVREKKLRKELWFYPFRLLRAQMARGAKRRSRRDAP